MDITKCDAKIKLLQKNYKNSKILYLSIDVGNIASVEQVFQDISAEFDQIDILVNSAGILNEIDAEQCLRVNLVRV